MSSTPIEYVLICIGRNTIHMYDKYIGPIHPIILLPMGDGNAAFRLASNLKTACLGSTCQGYNSRRYSLEGHGGTQASPPRQRSNNRGGFFWATAKLLYKRWKSDV